MKIVLWIGNESLQSALANKLHEVFPLTAIVTETRQTKKKLTLKIIIEKLFEKLFYSAIGKTWWSMLKNYEAKYPNYPNVEMLEVENINSDNVYEFTKKHNPDLILVSGTRLVKEKMLGINPTVGILNLHTGLSPYIKGGPNCTNWCLAKKEFHLIGNTIMWIDKGIDTGNILTTEFTDLNGNENLYELHVKVMEHAHNLYINAVKYLADGHRQSVKQSDISDGKTYYSKEWNLQEKRNLIRNFPEFKKSFVSGAIASKRKNIKTIELNPAVN